MSLTIDDIQYVDTLTASEIKSTGRLLDGADRGVVQINRRGQEYVVMSKSALGQMLVEAADPSPKTLADLLRGYDRDFGLTHMADWNVDEPVGKELI